MIFAKKPNKGYTETTKPASPVKPTNKTKNANAAGKQKQAQGTLN